MDLEPEKNSTRNLLRRQTKDTKCRKEDSSMDLISMLPDEILGLIVSQLSMKEATATSILCRRWRGLWTFTSRLDFNGVDSLVKLHLAKPPHQCRDNQMWLDYAIALRSRALDEQRRKYVRWVNQSLARLAKDFAIQCFKVSFNLTKSYQRFIDGWIRYALSREVQTLKLNLTHKANCGLREDEEYYVLPFRFLHNMHLKTISLHFVNVNGESLVSLLRNCPLLHDLSVCHSPHLSTLRIIGPFPSFKRFKITSCPNLKFVEIRDVDLVCFKYGGKRIQFLLHDVPMLVHISVELDDLLQFSSILPQLEMLNLCIRHRLDLQDSIMVYEGVVMSSLKQLVVKYSVGFVESLLPLTNLIRASPRLEKFVLKSRLYGEFCERKCENLYSHMNLKEVEFVGYHGTANELELVMYFVKNAVALEKILIDTRNFFESRYSQKLYDASKSAVIEEINSRLRVKKQLAKKVPADINLEIL